MTRDYSACPPPLLPAEVELRSYEFMKLNVVQLLSSKLAHSACRNPRALASGILLWAAAWHGAPAASIEDDDDILLVAARCPPEEWETAKATVLRGWVLCSDGRWWHPVVATYAWEAWIKKLEHAHRMECARLKKASQRKNNPVVSSDLMPFEQWLRHAHPQSYTKLKQLENEGKREPAAELPLNDRALSPGTTLNDRAMSPGTLFNPQADVPRDIALSTDLRGEEMRGDSIAPQPVPRDNALTKKDVPRDAPPPEAGPNVPFETFLEAYMPPRTFSRSRTLEAWKALVPKAAPAAVVTAAARLYAAERGDMVQDPVRFLTETWRNFQAEAAIRAERDQKLEAEVSAARAAWGDYASPVIAAVGEPIFRSWFRNTSLLNGGADVTVTVLSSLQHDHFDRALRPKLEAVFAKPFQIVTKR